MTLSLTYKHPKESHIVNLLCQISKLQNEVLHTCDAESLARTLLTYIDEIEALPELEQALIYATSISMVAKYPNSLQVLEVIQESILKG